MSNTYDRWTGADVLCPYCMGLGAREVYCESALPGVRMTAMFFRTREIRTAHMIRYCASFGYVDCPIAQAAEAAQEKPPESGLEEKRG